MKPKALFLLCLLILNSLYFSISFVKATGENWIPQYGYRKSHIINASSGAGNNYQIAIVCQYGNGTDGTINMYGMNKAGNVYLNGTCQTDFDDVRFTKDDGITLLNYWIEETIEGYNSTFWIKIEDSLESGYVLIYIYWGNDSVSDISDGINTFIEFDDFEDSSLNATKWKNYTVDAGTSISETLGNLQFSTSTGYAHTGGCVVGYTDLNSSSSKSLMTKAKITNNYGSSLGAYSGFTNSTTNFDTTYYGYPLSWVVSMLWYSVPNYLQIGGTGWTSKTGTINIGHLNYWIRVESRIIPNSYFNGTFNKTEVNYLSNSLTTTPSTSPVSPKYCTLGVGEYNVAETTTYAWLAIRKYITNEPNHNIFGSLESGFYIITLYYNTGGLIKIDGVTKDNTTSLYYTNQTIFEIACVLDFNYTMDIINWSYGETLQNPYNFTVYNATDLWCYFILSGVSITDDDIYSIGLILFVLLLFGVITVLVSWRKRKT